MRIAATLTSTPSPQPTTVAAPMLTEKSPWHSPVPYLFGGLAAMLGLIAFALLILACSYWKLSNNQQDSGENDDNRRDLEAGDEKTGDSKKVVYEEKIVVIMAGDLNPSFLATPMCYNKSGFGFCNGKIDEQNEEMGKMEKTEKVKELEESTTMENENCDLRETHVGEMSHEETQ